MIATARFTAAHAIKRLHRTHEHSEEIYQTWLHADLETQVSPVSELPEELNLNKPFERRYGREYSQDETPPYSFSMFAELIGSTGYNCKTGCLEFIGIDIDCGHGTNQQTPEQIEEIDQMLSEIPGVENRRSKGLKGRHVRVRINPIKVERHEVSALAGAIVRELGLEGRTCSVGLILHSYSKHASEKSFQLLSAAVGEYPVPENWRDYVSPQKASRNASVTLSDEHKRVIKEVERLGYKIEYGVLDGTEIIKTHTAGLLAAFNSLGLLGTFETISLGTEPGKPNCYLIPQPDGGWQVFRYGHAEESSWNRTDNDVSWCWFNCPPYSEDFTKLSEHFGGVQIKGMKKDARQFADINAANKMLEQYGIRDAIPAQLARRQYTLNLNDSSIKVAVPRLPEESPPDGWVASSKQFAATFKVEGLLEQREIEIPFIRVAYPYNAFGKQTAETQYFVTLDDGTIKPEPFSNVIMICTAKGINKEKAYLALGKKLANPLKISTEPFKSGETEGVWFRGYQYACEPKPGNHPHFDMVFRHTGQYLDPYVQANEWCRINGIKDGRDFLIAYAAIMVQHPEWRVPQLFLYSEDQETGKNTFADTLELLMEPGAVRDAKNAATSGSGFTGELEGALIYTLHEMDLSKSGTVAESRCREWVTNTFFEVHRKNQTPYPVLNYGRVIQTANSLAYKIVDNEDSRVIVIELSAIQDKKNWTTELRPALKSETASFLHTLLAFELPEKGAKGSRLYLPVFDTEAKKQAVKASLPLLSEDHDVLLSQVLDQREAGNWPGLLEYAAIQKLVDAPATPQSWRAFWNRALPHFKANGLRPQYRKRVEHKCSAAWGFK